MQKKKKYKAPAFQFYASDFYMDTMAWTDEMVGLHIRLMCQQWTNGHIDSDGKYPVGLDEKRRKIFDQIRHKYLQEKGGNFTNKKLKSVAKERVKFLQKASKAGTDGAFKRWGTPSKPHPNPNGENMTLQSSSSSSVFSNAAAAENAKWFEIFKSAAPKNLPDSLIWEEIRKLREKYPNNRAIKSGPLIQTWVSNLQAYEAPMSPSEKAKANGSWI